MGQHPGFLAVLFAGLGLYLLWPADAQPSRSTAQVNIYLASPDGEIGPDSETSYDQALPDNEEERHDSALPDETETYSI